MAAMSRTRLEPLSAGCTGCLCDPDLASAAGLGECIVAGDGAGGVVIVRADPRIAVSGILLLGWHDMTPPGFSLECRGGTGHIGDVIRAGAGIGRAVYVVTRLVTSGEPPRGNLIWEACWPD
jgi:hypothetical protein